MLETNGVVTPSTEETGHAVVLDVRVCVLHDLWKWKCIGLCNGSVVLMYYGAQDSISLSSHTLCDCETKVW